MPEEDQQKNEGKIKVEVKTEDTKEPKSRNSWIYSTVILVLIVIAMLGLQMTGMLTAPATGNIVTVQNQIISQDAGQKAVDFINDNLVQAGTSVTLDSVADMSGVYNVTTTYAGNEISVYITKDGKYLIVPGLGAIDIDNFVPPEPVQPQEPEPQQPSDFSEEDLEKLSGFVACLEEKGMRIYGANWCGWTQKLITSLGGFETTAPIYVECTEETETCQQEGVGGYPTIKINDEPYQSNDRSLAALAEATGCTAPSLEGNPATESSDGSCS